VQFVPHRPPPTPATPHMVCQPCLSGLQGCWRREARGVPNLAVPCRAGLVVPSCHLEERTGTVQSFEVQSLLLLKCVQSVNRPHSVFKQCHSYALAWSFLPVLLRPVYQRLQVPTHCRAHCGTLNVCPWTYVRLSTVGDRQAPVYGLAPGTVLVTVFQSSADSTSSSNAFSRDSTRHRQLQSRRARLPPPPSHRAARLHLPRASPPSSSPELTTRIDWLFSSNRQ
jgi:hypothetical protein